MTKVTWLLRSITITLSVLAVAFSGVLLAKDLGVEILPQLPVHVISAVSLLLVGAASLIVQPMLRLRPKELLKNLLLLGATFFLWGIVQLMPHSYFINQIRQSCGRTLCFGPSLGRSS